MNVVHRDDAGGSAHHQQGGAAQQSASRQTLAPQLRAEVALGRHGAETGAATRAKAVFARRAQATEGTLHSR